jgi:hypothetical protein
MHLKMLPDPVNASLSSQWPFESTLTRGRRLVEALEALKSFLEEADNRWLLGGKLAKDMKMFDFILARRFAIVQKMLKRAESGSGRESIIAGGIAFRLSTNMDSVFVRGTRLDKWLIAAMKKHRDMLLELDKKYKLSNPAKQIEIREDVLKKGLPGNPTVRIMWARRPEK